MIQAYIGEGKGKTTAALGLIMRATGAGWKVKLIQFDKGGDAYAYHERHSLQRLGVEVVVTGCNRQLPDGGFRFRTNEDDLAEARRGLQEAKHALVLNYRLLVLDELLTAVTYGLIPAADLHELLRSVPSELECVVTGRVNDLALVEACHLVSRIEKVRHYFDAGQPARPGIEF
ncbi:MAG TPA: cob(I)yrinic acid a,c-diamide adenosyltransferase [Candidatus Ozemobacteraceae bacterium]|nr:cob(I)yrinic acid a,c-diamide adenosyltransferase [Candidatus Ozemobacteraceae bacterium]